MFDSEDYDGNDTDADDDDESKSGPFCRHWGDPVDCEVRCASCGHECHQHNEPDAGNNCRECDCLDWVEEEE